MPPAWHKAPAVPAAGFVSGCSGKIRHTSAAEARRLLQRMPHLRLHHCRHCGGWHTTSQPKYGRG